MAYFLCINLCAEILNTEAYSNCTNISYRGKEYAPLFIPNENDPIMYVRLNLIFIQKPYLLILHKYMENFRL